MMPMISISTKDNKKHNRLKEKLRDNKNNMLMKQLLDKRKSLKKPNQQYQLQKLLKLQLNRFLKKLILKKLITEINQHLQKLKAQLKALVEPKLLLKTSKKSKMMKNQKSRKQLQLKPRKVPQRKQSKLKHQKLIWKTVNSIQQCLQLEPIKKNQKMKWMILMKITIMINPCLFKSKTEYM